MLKSRLCNYSDAYIHVKETITVPNTGNTAAPNNVKKKEYLKLFTPLLVA